MSAPLPVALRQVPFSVRGSFLALSVPDDQVIPGLYLRTVRGGARNREVLRLLPGGVEVSSVSVEAGRLTVTGGDCTAEIALSGPGRALIRVLSGTLRLEFCVRNRYDVVLAERNDAWRFIDSGAVRNYRLRLTSGRSEFRSGWEAEHSTDGVLDISAVDGAATLVLDEFGSAPPPDDVADFGGAVAAAADDFEGWWALHGAPALPRLDAADPALADAARLAAYVTWSALVPAGGALTRESMLVSKNRMAHIWSWDHCFNALALHRDPHAAVGQLLTIFDHQDEHGGLPDHIDDAGVQFNFAKPPIHGWTVARLLGLGALDDAQLASLDRPLQRWTRWWRQHRDYRGDGVPSYNHGNDSGWDNATVFGAGVPVQSPDLLAFLALQEDALARIAERLGRPADAAQWRARSADTVATLLDRFWTGERFTAIDTRTGTPIPSASLLTLMPLTLGEMLPREVFGSAVETLVTGGYLTGHGPATEPPTSPHYVPDGYWRGPVWAPTTLLLVDGLRRGGRADLAASIGRAFADACVAEGMAENFDALTGAGLRDRSMSWTASVFLLLIADTAQTGGSRQPAQGAQATGSRRLDPIRS
ncbi:trehalase family glycosidase [Leifsonia sp. F6_8S_P_1B]|uniref:Trehalase family glycosidase n=1 Tax=Leifsonia williamsii TaxID=3035919 RepID=A0ABT8K9K8_9MICO|nr:trehalase family glycosidase [Leifsonia williamsii]MDN4614135.1 trehalase family glycosidase [Leifsonia williamsii]